METVGERLTRLMHLRRLNATALARKSGNRKENINKWLADQNRPRPDHAAQLARALQVSTAYIYYGTNSLEEAMK